MKFLLLGKGKSIEAIKKYLKYQDVEYIQAVFDFEYSSKYLLIDDNLLHLDDIDYAIKSPGISETNKMYLKLSKKFKFISEIDLLSIFREKVKTIVVTGSNGKTTFVSMLHYLFKQAKIKSIAAGNSFKPLTSYYKQFNKIDYLILEQSSFQLHDLRFYHPFISIILNLQDNHLDNSYSLRSYFENKKNIYRYQNKKDYFIYDLNNTNLKIVHSNANIIDLLSYPNINKIKPSLQKYQINFNYIYTIFKILSIPIELIEKINRFETLPYREEMIQMKNVTFINDSKSTSVDATLFALSHIENLKKCILIIGGKDKHSSLERIKNIKVRYILCYGEIVQKATIQIPGIIPCKSLNEAFQIACDISMDHKIVLFSPATSSHDQYSSFIERGKHFNKLVKKYEKNRKDR